MYTQLDQLVLGEMPPQVITYRVVDPEVVGGNEVGILQGSAFDGRSAA
jgi:hypothetical protein